MQQMTLIVAAHNGKDLVVGSDTLALTRNSQTGEENSNPDRHKIYEIGTRGVLLLSGVFNEDSVETFLRYFCYNARSITDIDRLYRLFSGESDFILTTDFHGKDKIEVIMAGFDTKDEPKIYCVRVSRKGAELIKPKSPNYEATGHDEPSERIFKELDEFDISAKTTRHIERFLKSSINKCIKDYPSMLGGKAAVKVLKKPDV